MTNPSIDLVAIAGPYPSGPTRGRLFDWLAFQVGKTGQRARSWLGGRRTRPHRQVLSMAVAEIMTVFSEPTCVETGCIRREDEGTSSTLAIAESLAGRGSFFTFELEEKHLEVCRRVCKAYERHIRYVQGDAKENLSRLRREGELGEIHLAFFDSADDPQQTLAEFRAIEDLFVPGSLMIVDDAVRGVKGRLVKPLLHASGAWETRIVRAGNGMLLAKRC